MIPSMERSELIGNFQRSEISCHLKAMALTSGGRQMIPSSVVSSSRSHVQQHVEEEEEEEEEEDEGEEMVDPVRCPSIVTWEQNRHNKPVTTFPTELNTSAGW